MRPTPIPDAEIMSVRCVLEDGDLEKLQDGGTVWITFWGAMVPWAATVVGPPVTAMTGEQAAAAADERARIVWWLRAGITGPGAVNATPDYLAAASELADAIEQHPERFAQAPARPPSDTRHPEEYCHRCGGPNISWWTPPEAWNPVMRPGGDDTTEWLWNEIICPTCFGELFEATFPLTSWLVLPDERTIGGRAYRAALTSAGTAPSRGDLADSSRSEE